MKFAEFGVIIQGTENTFVKFDSPVRYFADEGFDIIKEHSRWDIELNKCYSLEFVIPELETIRKNLNKLKLKYQEDQEGIAASLDYLIRKVVVFPEDLKNPDCPWCLEGPFDLSQIYIRIRDDRENWKNRK